MHSYAIRLNFSASDHAMDCVALLAGLVASVSKCMKDLHVFIDSLTLVPDHTSFQNLELQNRSVNMVGDYKAGIPQPRSFGGNQDKTIGRSGKNNTQGTSKKPNYDWETSRSN
ncbi:hypothetical protein Tco_0637181 [Tanacetum coccineum]